MFCYLNPDQILFLLRPLSTFPMLSGDPLVPPRAVKRVAENGAFRRSVFLCDSDWGWGCNRKWAINVSRKPFSVPFWGFSIVSNRDDEANVFFFPDGCGWPSVGVEFSMHSNWMEKSRFETKFIRVTTPLTTKNHIFQPTIANLMNHATWACRNTQIYWQSAA